MAKHKHKTGFTLVELSLSLVFIGILSLAIVLMISNAIGSYQRGLTLNQVNTVGMELVSDIRATIQSSPAKSPSSTYYYVRNGRRSLAEDNGSGIYPVSGVFCTGAYTYIWNSGYYFTEGFLNNNYRILGVPRGVDIIDPISFKYKDSSGSSQTKSDFKLLKIKDKTTICSQIAEGIATGSGVWDEGSLTRSVSREAIIDMSDTPATYSDDDITELLATGSNTNLAVYDLSVGAPATASGATFYSVTFILGTLQGGINITASGDFCTVPEGANSAFNYCSINKFNFAAQATGGNNV